MSQTSALAQELPFHILTDLGNPETWHKACRQACSKSEALDTLFSMIEKREIPRGELRSAYDVKDDSVTLEQAELFFYLLTQIKPNLSLEIGFGDGLLSGVLTATQMYNGLKGGHIPVQNRARAVYNGIGFYVMESLKLEGYQIMEHPSATVLPQIYLQQINDGLLFAYFNSATSFDEQMMEYFYVSRLLNEGGVMAINTSHPVRAELVDFIRKDRHDYAIREMACGVTLVQVPKLTDLAGLAPASTH